MPHLKKILFLTILCFALGKTEATAQIPHMIPYTGTIEVNGTPFNGEGRFKFALVGEEESPLWFNDSDDPSGLEPLNFVTLPVNEGVFTVKLGDDSLSNMVPITVNVFSTNQVFLRIWFNDGATGFQQLSPDRQLVSVPYAYRAEVADALSGAVVDSAQIIDSAVTAPKIASQAVTSFAIADGTISSGDLSFDPATQGELDAHASAPFAHHLKTSSFSELTGQIADAQIPNGITRDTELSWNRLTDIPPGFADGIDHVGGGNVSDSDWTISGNDMFSGVPGNVGIGTPKPQSELQVKGYVQLDTITTATPPTTDCDEITENGRMKVGSNRLWICTAGKPETEIPQWRTITVDPLPQLGFLVPADTVNALTR